MKNRLLSRSWIILCCNRYWLCRIKCFRDLVFGTVPSFASENEAYSTDSRTTQSIHFLHLYETIWSIKEDIRTTFSSRFSPDIDCCLVTCHRCHNDCSRKHCQFDVWLAHVVSGWFIRWLPSVVRNHVNLPLCSSMRTKKERSQGFVSTTEPFLISYAFARLFIHFFPSFLLWIIFIYNQIKCNEWEKRDEEAKSFGRTTVVRFHFSAELTFFHLFVYSLASFAHANQIEK